MTRKDKIFAIAKGMRGRAKNCYRIAVRQVEKGLQYAYKSRRLKKRIARQEWITQMSSGAREHGIVYSKLVQGMGLANIGVNRKIMAVLAQQEPYSFRAIIEESKSALKRTIVGDRPALQDHEPSIVPDARAPTEADPRGRVPDYDGPPLPPYPRRYQEFS